MSKHKYKLTAVITVIFFILEAFTLMTTKIYASSVKKSFRMELDQVEVINQRERDGDRPYTVMIPFQSKVLKRGTTKVWLVESEPHDWVSKNKYNRALRGRNHMKRGDRLRLPWWMSFAEYQKIDVLDTIRDGMPWVFGAIIVTLDNNNTPPHVVRNLLNQVKRKLNTLLVRQLERGDLLRGVSLLDVGAIERQLKNKVPLLAKDLVSNLSFNIFDWTFGSTFNPDKITGIQVYLWASLKNIRRGNKTGRRSIAGEPFTWKAEWGPPPTVIAPFRFIAKGSKAQYKFSGRIREITPKNRTVNRVQVKIKTGSDDLRSDASVDIVLRGRGSKRATLSNIAGSRGLPRYSDMTFSSRLPSGWKASDVIALDIRTRGGNGGFMKNADEWDLLGISIRLIGSGVNEIRTIKSKSPIHHFTEHSRIKSLIL